MELIDVVRILRRRWSMIAVILVFSVLGGAAATARQPKIYRTTTGLIVSGVSSSAVLDETTRRQLAAKRAAAYAQIVTTAPAVDAAVAAAVAAQPGLPQGYPAVAASASGNDPFLTITVSDRNPRRAAAVANAYAGVLPGVIAKLEGTPNEIAADISTLTAAGVPAKPYTPRPVRNGLISLVAGLVLGVGAAFVREALDRRLRDSDEVETASGVTLLGVVPSEELDSRIPVETHPMSTRAEAYRKVRTNLTFTTADGLPRSILITSSTSGEGKTTLATNLALACARTGSRVLLIDADLRRPTVASYTGLDDGDGLTNYLSGRRSFSQVVRPIGTTVPVDVMTSGPIPPNPSELLGSTRMDELLRAAESEYDVVIVDAPPVLPVADALVLAVLVEAVVLVAKVGETTRDRLRRSKDAILKVKANLVGVVPNGVVQSEDSAYAYAYRYRSKKNPDSLELYTKQARLPEVDETGAPLVATPDPDRGQPDLER